MPHLGWERIRLPVKLVIPKPRDFKSGGNFEKLVASCLGNRVLQSPSLQPLLGNRAKTPPSPFNRICSSFLFFFFFPGWKWAGVGGGWK